MILIITLSSDQFHEKLEMGVDPGLRSICTLWVAILLLYNIVIVILHPYLQVRKTRVSSTDECHQWHTKHPVHRERLKSVNITPIWNSDKGKILHFRKPFTIQCIVTASQCVIYHIISWWILKGRATLANLAQF